ncbi:hypothetical protein [Mesorhizobium sp. RIZ17]|uniref:hypothetical protein n=1 Tax=Mesorhizobium sp. RIZ17 TaxID=3132743 RepID=UPI003DA8FC67
MSEGIEESPTGILLRACNLHEAALENDIAITNPIRATIECSVVGVGHSSYTLPPVCEFVDADNGEFISGRMSPAAHNKRNGIVPHPNKKLIGNGGNRSTREASLSGDNSLRGPVFPGKAPMYCR